jgi:two-component system, NtrC family, sensor kinase
MNTNKSNILVVDDTHANLKLLVQILADENYIVRPIPDGAFALSAARAEPPDLILLDIMMPGMSGYEVCEQLKADERTRDIPVIFISAKSEVTDKVKAFSIGGVDYVSKPFQTEEVLARVRTHLSLSTLQKNLEEKNKALSDTLKELKAAQQQMILREKMAALGHLIAGIAHEINTPLGAIRASIANISNAMNLSIRQLPQLFQQLSPERQADFFALTESALQNNEEISSREARKIRRELTENLLAENIPDADSVAHILVNMGVYKDISSFLNLLREKDNTLILQTAYHLFVQQNNSQNITMAVERASKIVFALKSYAHHDHSGEKIVSKIADGIEVVLTLCHNQLKKGIKLVKNYRDIPDIFCYPDELNQVWTNLIYNAIHAMEGNGQLEIDISEQDSDITVRITDSGHGIPESIRERVFEPFFTTKPAGEGSGLGLDLVRKIIERHHGRITVESQPGKTTFSVFLPKNDQEMTHD